MKILFISPFMRVPPDFGLAIRNYHLLRHIAQHHSTILMTFEIPHQGVFVDWAREHMTEFVSLGPYPQWDGKLSTRRMIRRILEFTPSAFARLRPHEIAHKVQAVLEKHRDIELLVFDSHLVAQAASHLKLSRIPMVAVLLDIYSVCARRQFVNTALRPYKFIYGLDWLRTSVFEHRALSCFKHIITMSEGDASLMRSQFPQARVFVSPNGVDTEYFAPKPRIHEGKNLVFVGNFSYAPNEDGFFFFVREIFPRIHAEFPETTFTAVGLSPTAAMRAEAMKDPRIRIIGNVPDVRDYYPKADIAVIPLRLGGGVKLKVLEAMSVGVPVVATHIGIEGIGGKSGEHFLRADEPRDFADAVISLLRPDGCGRMLTANARALARVYDWSRVAKAFESVLVDIVSHEATPAHEASHAL